jgi:hypothetical protein
MRDLLFFLLFQIETFASAKDWVVLALIGLVGALVGGAWADLKGKIRTLEVRLEAKIEEDKVGYERLTRCEERLDALRLRRKNDYEGGA